MILFSTEATSLQEYVVGLKLEDMDDDILAQHVETARTMKTPEGLNGVLKGLNTYMDSFLIFADLDLAE